MSAGLPGTGIAGLFYLLSIFIILFYESFLTIRGKSSKKRWLTILPQISIATIMIIMGYFTTILFTTSLQVYRTRMGLPHKEIHSISPLLIPIILLICVLASVYAGQLFLSFTHKRQQKKLRKIMA